MVKGGMGDGQRVCWAGRGMYGSWEWEEDSGLWVSLSLTSSKACEDEVLALNNFLTSTSTLGSWSANPRSSLPSSSFTPTPSSTTPSSSEMTRTFWNGDNERAL